MPILVPAVLLLAAGREASLMDLAGSEAALMDLPAVEAALSSAFKETKAAVAWMCGRGETVCLLLGLLGKGCDGVQMKSGTEHELLKPLPALDEASGDVVRRRNRVSPASSVTAQTDFFCATATLATMGLVPVRASVCPRALNLLQVAACSAGVTFSGKGHVGAQQPCREGRLGLQGLLGAGLPVAPPLGLVSRL